MPCFPRTRKHVSRTPHLVAATAALGLGGERYEVELVGRPSFDATQWKPPCVLHWLPHLDTPCRILTADRCAINAISEEISAMTRICGVVLALTLLTLTGCTNMKLERIRSRLKSTEAKNFKLTSLGGTEVSLSDFRGKPVLLSFFAAG